MDRDVAMLMMLGFMLASLLMFLALFAVAPIFCSCLVSLLYTVYVFIANERSGVHHAQEYENRFWTIFATLLSTALFFAKDSPLALGRWNASLGFMGVVCCGYGMHAWDRHIHRRKLSRQVGHTLKRRTGSVSQSLVRLSSLGIPIQDQLAQINSCLSDIDQLLIPSTINNFINQRFILRKEREIISIFEEAEQKALNYLIAHSRLGLLFYKIKDHRNFSGQHRTELIELLAVERISQLTVISRVIVLHALQIMKLPANTRAEYWVRNIILSTKQDDLSELKTLTDAKGDYFCMSKLIFDDIRSETVRQDLLNHFQKEARVQQAHMKMKTKKAKIRSQKAWRKVLSDVDDTLSCSAGSYPAGIDKRFGKKVVYPGVLGFYRELDLGTHGPEEWPSNTVGNLVFLSARPHVYKDVSEKQNFAKFAKLHERRGPDGRGGMHTIPSLLPGDLTSGTEFIMKNDFEPLAVKKFENFKKYVSIYPEFKHVFVCDNGQGDVRAGEMMFDSFPNHVEAVYVHIVQGRTKTYGYAPDRWKKKGFKPIFFRTYPEAALDAAKRKDPLIRTSGLRRICQDSVADFFRIQTKQWPSQNHKWDRRDELNQSLWQVNKYLLSVGERPIELIMSERTWKIGERVKTPYGTGKIIDYRSIFDTYEVELDWRPLDVQTKDQRDEKEAKDTKQKNKSINESRPAPLVSLETVLETEEEGEEDNLDSDKTNGTKNTMAQLSISTEVNTVAKSTSVSPFNKELPKVKDVEKASPMNIDDRVLSPRYCEDKNLKSNLSEDAGDKSYEATPIIATIQGRQISKYIVPKLPTFPKDEEPRSVFSFWTASTDTGKSTKSKSKSAFKPGDKCSTPFGAAIVKEYREKQSIVVVDFTKWSARAYLQEKDVKIGGSGFFSSLFKRALAKETDKSSTKETELKEIEIQYVKGSVINTPFGTGVIVRPLPLETNTKTNSKIVFTEDGTHDGSTLTGQKSSTLHKTTFETIGISLTSWVLANKSNPTLYCTVSTLKQWKQTFEEDKSKTDTGGILSVFGNIVSQSIQFIKRQPEKESVPSEIIVPREEQYYKDGAAVTTLYGDGIVTSYRETDGFYVVSLNRWGNAKTKKTNFAYLRKDCLSHRIALGCHEGYPVLTSLGLTGILASVEPSTGVHIVTIPTARMVCYLQPKDVIKPLKAAVGEDVLTPYGEGKLKRYRSKDDIYEISLVGTGATLFCKGESFDRAQDRLEDEGSFGLKFLLRFFFSDREKNDGDSRRSRSNSIGSLSATKSLSARSIL